MHPDEIDALLERANRLLEAGKPDESLECLDEVDAATLDGDDRIEWASLRAWALTEMGRDDEALETLDPLLDEFPHSPRLLGTLGVVLSNTDDLEDARDALEEAVEAGPDDEVSVANLALVYEKLREYEQADALYDRALQLGADIDWILQRKAAALTEMGRFAEAKAALKRYLSLDPEDASQWIALAILHSDDEEFEEAYTCYRRAEEIDPVLPALRLNWGVSAVRAHDLEMARAQLRLLQQLEPRSTRPWLLRAFILEEERNLTAARVIYERILARARFPDEAEQVYALEMAMDFFARHQMRSRCDRLIKIAYDAGACTVELCEAFREATGDAINRGYWFSVMVEADYRPGLPKVRSATPQRRRRRRDARFVRAYQVVARNHDEALGTVMDFARAMGEKNPAVREFVGEEKIADTFTGIYEVEPECYLVAEEERG